jgi:hypothetical protein
MDIDWNHVFRILDDLSEGPSHSLAELSYSADRYSGDGFAVALAFLVQRNLVEVKGDEGQTELLEAVKAAFATKPEKRDKLPAVEFDLSPNGRQLLSLVGVGYGS